MIERHCMPSLMHDAEDIFDSKVTRNEYAVRTLVDSYVSAHDVGRFVQEAAAGPDTIAALFQWPERYLHTTKAVDEASFVRFCDNMLQLGLHTSYTGVDAPGYAIGSLSAALRSEYGVVSEWCNMMGWELEDFDFILLQNVKCLDSRVSSRHCLSHLDYPVC